MDTTANTSTLDQAYATSQQTAPVMSTKDWLITLLLLAIPLVNLVLLFVWAFGSDNNPNKTNFSKAYLILIGIIMGLYAIILALVFSLGGFN